jgi:hypothetical protein
MKSPIGPAIIASIIGRRTVPARSASPMTRSAAIVCPIALIASDSVSSPVQAASTVPPPGMCAASLGRFASIRRRASARPSAWGMSNESAAMVARLRRGNGYAA